MERIERQDYLNKLIAFKDKNRPFGLCLIIRKLM